MYERTALSAGARPQQQRYEARRQQNGGTHGLSPLCKMGRAAVVPAGPWLKQQSNGRSAGYNETHRFPQNWLTEYGLGRAG